MDCEKTGRLIKELRRGMGLTQLQLAGRIGVSDKAVSKWERGRGCPDVSLLSQLSAVLGVELEGLLHGQLDANGPVGGNMKKLLFYVCPDCGNILTATAPATISCCGRKLEPLHAAKAAPDKRLVLEKVENEYYITSNHPMTKDDYISLVALLTGDRLLLHRCYPEWELQLRFPLVHGRLLWYSTRQGLMYFDI